jgi:VanZ family protein
MRSTTTNSSNPVGIGKTHLFNSLTVLLMTMAFALSDEIHQLFVPGRAFQVIDLIIDFLGLLFGVYLYQRLKIEPQR